MPDDPQLYALTEKDRSLVDGLLAKNERFVKETSPAPLKYRPPLENIVAFTIDAINGATGDITSGTGMTPGTGTVQRCFWDGTVWKPTTDNPYTAHNLGLTYYPANCQIDLAKINGIWAIVELDMGVGVANENIASGSPGDVRIMWGPLPSVTESGNTLPMYNPATAITSGDIVRFNRTNGQLECYKICDSEGGGGSVTSVTFTGDGTVLSSTPSSAVTSTGTLTAALAAATAKSLLANSTGSSAAPSYTTSPVVSGSMSAAQHIPTSSSAPSNGMYLPSTNTVGLASNSTLQFSVNTSGAVVANQITVPQTGLKINDASTHTLTLKPNETLSADRTLSITTGDGNRSIAITGTSVINQDVSTFGAPSFLGMVSSSTTGRTSVVGYFTYGQTTLSLTANTDDAVLTTGGSLITILSDGDYHLTGMVPTWTNEQRSLINASAFTITIDHQNSSSSTINRFYCPNNTDLVLGPNQSILMVWTAGGWHALNSFTTSAGTVTSVALTVPSGLSVSGSPVTGTGTLAISTALSGVVTANGSAFSATAIPSDATKFLNGASTAAFALVKDSDLSLSNITTNNATISQHGFVRTGNNDASYYLDGTHNWSIPSGSGVTFGNPTQSIDLSVHNGSAGTAMRSDAAPQLSQSISPHWTGNHQFDVLRLTDVGTAHYGTVAIGSTYTSNRTLSLVTGDADRAITLTGNPTLADWFDQAVKAASSPTFVTETLSGLTASKVVFTDGSKVLTSSGTVGTIQGGTGFANGYSAGDVLIGKSDGTLARAPITAGANVTITLGDGTIQIAAAGGGTGSAMVGPVSVVTSHGFAGTVANATTVPAITLSTTLNTPVIAGDGTSLIAATTTGSGSTVVLGTSPSIATSLTLTGSSPTLKLNDALGTHTLTIIAGSTLTGNRQLSLEFDNNAVLALAGDFTTNAAIELPVVAQGDVFYGSASDVMSSLAKSTSATRYLSNQGTSNNPSWSLVNVANGVTGTLAVVNGGTGVSNSYVDGDLLIGNSTGNTLTRHQLTMGSGMSMTVGHGTITLSASGAGGGTGTVTSVSIAVPPEGITQSGSPITGSGTITLDLGNDLAAVEGLITEGLACRVGTDSWNTATITGTSARITVNNGDGVSGDPIIDISASYVGQTSITTLGTVTTGTWSATTIALNKGGTGQSLSDPAANKILAWDDTDNAVGFWALGSGLSYDHSTHTLSSTGSGGVSSVSCGSLSPLFTTSVTNATTTPAIAFTLSNSAQNTYFGNATGSTASPSYTSAAALTKTDDTNVTLSLGGSPTVCLLKSASLTLGWNGTLSLARGGTGTSLTDPGANRIMGWDDTDNAVQFWTIGSNLLYTHSTHVLSAVAVTSIGIIPPAEGMTVSGSPVTSSGNITLTLANDLDAVEGLITTGLACRVGTDSWNTATITGVGGRITVLNGDGVSGDPSVDISSSYVGQTTITTLGTVTTGTWSATNIALSKGGTGSSLSDPNANKILAWDDTDNTVGFWTLGSGLSYDHSSHTLSSSGSAVSIATSNGITGGTITGTGTISGIDAAADGSTKGVAAFSSSLFTASSGVISTKFQMSITSDSSGMKLSGDQSSPGNVYVYATNGSGTKGWYTLDSLLKLFASYSAGATQVFYNDSSSLKWQTCT